MTNSRRILLLMLIWPVIENSLSVESVERNTWQGIPCDGIQNELTQHRDIAACRASWKGHIGTGAGGICRGEWELCGQKYSRILNKISWYEASHVSGCYAVNASHGAGGCTSCSHESSEDSTEMASIGADCLTYQRSTPSCFGEGRIHASDSRLDNHTRCHYAPWITGVLCCRKGSQSAEVRIYAQVTPSPEVMAGTEFKLHCHVTGVEPASYLWFHNGSPLASPFDQPVLPMNATESHSGAWKCEAIYGHRRKESRQIYLRVIKWEIDHEENGCKNESRGKMLASAGGNVALCEGNWNSHVQSASTNLCAKGWKVCSNEDRPSLYSILWQEVMKIQGCFAYNAASTKYYPCAKCSPKNKGNRMAGIGRGCGSLRESGYSCLGKGRMDVYGARGLLESGKRLRSCRHAEGITTGVVCCKKTRREKRRPPCKCKNGGKCLRLGGCDCPPGFRGKRCQKSVSRRRRRHGARR